MNKIRASYAGFQAALIGLVCVQLACSRLQQATGNVDAFTMLITREFSHFDDPVNVLETP